MKIEENMAVYEALRENIVQREEDQQNATIYMYVIYFALLAIAANTEKWSLWLVLLSFVDLIVFQSMINDCQWGASAASVYIRVFFEERNNDIHWEGLHRYSNTFYRPNFWWSLFKFSASILGVISFGVLAVCTYPCTSKLSLILFLAALLLCLITCWINWSYFRMIKRGEYTGPNLSDAIRQFHDQIAQESETAKSEEPTATSE